MADKPSRALVLYGDGLARFIGPAQTHLNSFSSRACCGFLALPHSPPSENEESRIIREFAELLDANEAYGSGDVKKLFEDKPQEKCAFSTRADRFMGMKAAIVTDNLNLKSFGDKLGLTMLLWDGIFDNSRPSSGELPLVASRLLEFLGFQEGKTLDSSQFDLVLLHVGANKNIDDLNNLVGILVHMAHSGTDIGLRLHMSVIMSYGATLGDDHLKYPFPESEPKNNGEQLSVCIPRQSYAMKGGKPRENIRQFCPMLLAQYQNAVTRKDLVETFTFTDFFENGGNLVIPADRFLHEVAFKLWKAPKYGA